MVSGAPAARRTASIVGQPAVAAQPEAARTHAAAPQASGPAPASAEASIAARARQRPVRKLSTALQRLDRELKQVRGRPATPQPGQAAAAPAAASEGGHGRAHLEQLLRMRASAMAQKQAPGQTELTAADDFRYGQEALRDQQFGRAHEHLRKACDSEPNNEVYAMFSMWAAFRANLMQGDDVNKLRTALRARVSDDEHKAFAYYALGHLSLADKRDDLAEKFFRKAIELNRQNKDAERHLRIIELRRKTAASEQRAGKIFGIEIGIKKS
jgi:tetratricopeptide (TPR) repeat protein